MFRAYSAERRDRAPIIETEDFRDEGARRFWDDYSPPYYGFKKGPNDTWKRDGFLYTSESFALAGVKRYWEYWHNRISNTDPAHSRWSGYCSIYFTDEDADGRQDSSEVCPRQRQGGRHAPAQGDLLRPPRHPERHSPTCTSSATGPIPPPSPMAPKPRRPSTSSPTPSRSNSSSTANPPASTPSPTAAGSSPSPTSPSRPAASRPSARTVARSSPSRRSSPPVRAAAIKLTPILGPSGLQADGEDIALIDFEVVDAKGERCPTDDARVDFTCTGPAIWRGGYNSGKSSTPPTTSTSTPSSASTASPSAPSPRATDRTGPSPSPPNAMASSRRKSQITPNASSSPTASPPSCPQHPKAPAEEKAVPRASATDRPPSGGLSRAGGATVPPHTGSGPQARAGAVYYL